MMNGKGKRLLSLVLALFMLSTLLPAAALAGNDDHGLAEAYFFFFSGGDWGDLTDTLPVQSDGSVVFCVSAGPAQSEDVPPGGTLSFLSIYNEEGTGDYLLYEGTTAYYGGTYDYGGIVGLTIPNVAEGVYSVKLLFSWPDGSYKAYVCDKAVTIGAAGSRAPVITTASLPDGKVGESYTATLMASGGSNAYTWSVSGKLPDGLTLEASTGILSGTPKKADYFTFNVICSSVVDGETLQSKPRTLSVNIKQTFLTLKAPAAVTDDCSRSVAITQGDTLIRSFYLGSGTIAKDEVIFTDTLEPGSYTATLTGANAYGTVTYGHVDFTFPAEMDVTIPLSPELILPTEGVVVANVQDLDELAHYDTLVRLEAGGCTFWHYAEACTVFRGALRAEDTAYTATLGFYDAYYRFVPLASETVTITDGASRICTLTPDWNVLDNYREYALRTLPDDGALSVSLVLDGTPIYTNNYSRYLLHRDDAALAAAGKLTAEVSCGAEALRTRYDFSRPTAALDSSSASILVTLPELDRSAAVGGKVTSGGKAVPGVSITASQSVNGSELSVMTVSGSDGSYTLRGLVSGASAYVTAAAEGYQTAALTVPAPGAETTGANFDLTPQATITVFLNGSATDARISVNGGSFVPCGTGGVFTVPVGGDGSYTVSLTADNISGQAVGTAAVKDGAGALTLYADFYGWLDFSGVNTGSCVTMVYQGDQRVDCCSYGSLSLKPLPAGEYTVYFVKNWVSGKPAAADILAQTNVTVAADEITKVEAEVSDGSPAASGSVTGPAEAAPGEIYKVTGVLNEVSGKEFFLVFQTPRASIQSIVLNGSLVNLHSGSGAQVSVHSDDNPQVDWTLPMTFTVYVMQDATEAEPYQMLTVQAVCNYQDEYIGSVSTKYVPGLTLSAGAVVGNAGSGKEIRPGSVPFYGTAPAGRTVYLYDNGWDTWAAYQPWYAASWYSWHRPYYSSIYWGMNPWYYGGWYGGWYDPWYYRPYYHYGWYGGWYDPWFYDPWYYGGWYGGWYDPWFYGGWYGGWYSPWYWHAGYSWHYHGWGHVNRWGNIGFGGGDRVYRPRIATNATSTRSGIGSAARSAGTRSSAMTRSRTGATTRSSTATRSSGTGAGTRSSISSVSRAPRTSGTSVRSTTGTSTVNNSRSASTGYNRSSASRSTTYSRPSTSSSSTRSTGTSNGSYRSSSNRSYDSGSTRSTSGSYSSSSSRSSGGFSGGGYSGGGGGGYSGGGSSGGGGGRSSGGGGRR